MQVQHLESNAGLESRTSSTRPHTRTFMAGGYGAGDPPDPIPNSEVKTRCADGTAGATRWESTAPPAYYSTTPALILVIRAGVCRFRGFRLASRLRNGMGLTRSQGS